MRRLEPARDANGRWRPGVSGNPIGRRAETAETKLVRSLARVHTAEAVESLRAIMLDPNAQAMARVQAAKELLARGWGQPADEVLLDAVDARHADEPIRFMFKLGEDDEEVEGELADDQRPALPAHTA